MFREKRDAEARLAGLFIDDLPLESCPAAPVPFPADWFPRFRRARAAFLESLGDSISELALLNLAKNDFMGLLTAQRIPENLCVKFRRPMLYGGEIAPENMFLTPLFPSGMNIDVFMAEQSGQGEIWYPNPAKKIYVSVSVISGGEGGNATSDRLAQSFAHMAQERE
jgi:hypothetical protein